MLSASDIVVRIIRADSKYHSPVRKFLNPRGNPDLQAQEIKKFCVSQLGNKFRLNKMENALIDEILRQASWTRVRILLQQSLDNNLEPEKISHLPKKEASNDKKTEKAEKEIIYL